MQKSDNGQLSQTASGLSGVDVRAELKQTCGKVICYILHDVAQHALRIANGENTETLFEAAKAGVIPCLFFLEFSNDCFAEIKTS